MLICAILWLAWLIWGILCLTVLKNIDQDWHVILFWTLLTVAVCSIPIYVFIGVMTGKIEPFWFWVFWKR